MTKPPYQINSSLRKNYPAHHPHEGGGTEDEVIPISRGGTGATTVQGARNNLGTNDASNLTTGTLPNARVSNSLPRDKAYRQGNILGTVAQSGGAPTGAIIERGSNANGEYVRFADGTQICWKSETVVVDDPITTVTWPWTFPAAFSALPVPTSGFRPISVSGSNRRFNIIQHGITTMDVSLAVSAITGQPNLTIGDEFRIDGVAYGRWF